jgi:hypothetical protein
MKTLIMNDRKNEDFYIGEDGTVMRRETGKMPNGDEIDREWVLRDKEGNYIGHGQFRQGLAERNGFELKHDYEI